MSKFYEARVENTITKEAVWFLNIKTETPEEAIEAAKEKAFNKCGSDPFKLLVKVRDEPTTIFNDQFN